MQSYTLTGPCDVLLVEAVPGGPFDIFTDRPSPAEHLRRLHAMLPSTSRGRANCTGTPSRPTRAPPWSARSPAPSAAPTPRSRRAAYVFGIGDVVVVNDPISGQGANNAAHAAGMYLKAILDRGDAPFTPQWMQQTFDTFWAHAQNSLHRSPR